MTLFITYLLWFAVAIFVACAFGFITSMKGFFIYLILLFIIAFCMGILHGGLLDDISNAIIFMKS